VLLSHPRVCQAAAFAIPHPTLGEDLAAAVTVLAKDETIESLIREYLTKRLAEFKVPRHILVLDDLPKGSTGKIQRHKLAAKFIETLQKEFVEPRNELELVVSSIFAGVLDIPRVSVNDDFLALGGDSLRAMQVLSRVRILFQVNLSIVTLFKKRTVAELANEIARVTNSSDDSPIAAILTELENLSEEKPGINLSMDQQK
jgi:acyl carrier protein